METRLFINKQVDVALVTKALQEGRINVDPDGKTRISHPLANNVSTVVELQVTEVKIVVDEAK